MSKKNVFQEGAIDPAFVASSIAKHQHKTNIGAHNIFLGQVRADNVNGKKVTAIEFSNYPEMAEKKIGEIREDAFAKFNLTCMHIHHSLGHVKAGELCIFVFVSSGHRTPVYDATAYIVDRIKTEVPIFGKEYFENEEYQWKQNTVGTSNFDPE